MNNKKIYRIIIITIFIMILISIFIPIFLDIFIWGNKIPSNISNSDWSGFLGSFLGGILGSIGSLIGIYITIFETRSAQQKTIHESIIKSNTEKLDLIIELTSIYWKEIKSIKTCISNIFEKQCRIDYCEKEIKNIENDMAQNSGMSDKQLAKLKDELSLLTKEKNNLTMECEFNKVIDISNLTHSYFMIVTTLRNIEIANSYRAVLKNIYDNISNVCDCNKFDKNTVNDLNNWINELNSSFEEFVNIYEKNYIKI